MDEIKETNNLDKLEIKTGIKKTAGKCSMLVLVASLFTYAFIGSVTYLLKLRGKLLGIDLSVDADSGMYFGIPAEVYSFVAGTLPCILADILIIVIAMKIFDINFKKDLFGKNKASYKFIGLGALSSISIGTFSVVIYYIYSTIIESNGLEIPAPDYGFTENIPYFILTVSYICFISPLLEEIIFRGFILRSLQKYGNLAAIIVSSILFSMFHGNLVQFINPFLIGILFSFMSLKSGTIKASIMAHIFNNSMAMISSIVSGVDIPMLNYFSTFFYYVVVMIAFILFIVNYTGDFIKIVRKGNTVIRTYKKVFYSFANLWSIAYIVYYIVLIGGVMFIANTFE